MNTKVIFCIFCGFSVFKVRITSYVPHQSGISSTVALAIPIDGRGDIFLSFCLSVAYGQPEYDSPDGIDPDPQKMIYGDTEDSRKRSKRNSVLTRRKFFHIFADKLKEMGFDADHCILKIICETTQYQFGAENGLLGDIIHILFTPTTSKDESLPSKFYEAETNGRSNLCEKKYGAKCPVSIFDLITIMK